MLVKQDNGIINYFSAGKDEVFSVCDDFGNFDFCVKDKKFCGIDNQFVLQCWYPDDIEFQKIIGCEFTIEYENVDFKFKVTSSINKNNFVAIIDDCNIYKKFDNVNVIFKINKDNKNDEDKWYDCASADSDSITGKILSISDKYIWISEFEDYQYVKYGAITKTYTIPMNVVAKLEKSMFKTHDIDWNVLNNISKRINGKNGYFSLYN